MNAAVVHDFDLPPRYGAFEEPTAWEGEALVEVRAAALSQLVRARASGRHYSVKGLRPPFVPGFDGVGALADGRRVYFAGARPPFGAMAERTAVRESRLIPVPEGLDDVAAAALANPAMSSWAALACRARLQKGETVLVHGAAGVSGALAVRIARHLGAGRVVAMGRNAAALAKLPADATARLDEGDDALRRAAEGVDVVLDYLWGPPAERLLGVLAGQVRFVQVGSVAGGTVSLDAHLLRSTGLELMGSGLGSVPDADLLASIAGAFGAAASAGVAVETEVAPLAQVEAAWGRDTGSRRLVFVP